VSVLLAASCSESVERDEERELETTLSSLLISGTDCSLALDEDGWARV
jgi:hypothetical protein